MNQHLPEFSNEPFTDFSLPENTKVMQNALTQVTGRFEQEYPIVIGGEKIKTGSTFTSYNPAQPSQTIGKFQKADAAWAEKAVDAAWAAFPTWSKTPAEARAEYLLKASELVKARKFEIAAAMVYEVGKSWAEADGDVAEAIDFLEFYAREMLRYAEPQPITPYPGEANEAFYLPLGVGAIIPPWNFPFAILVGMSTAAIVTGNTVVLKPAEESMLMGALFVEIMEEVGLPPGVLNFITGDGAELGGVMVNHPLTRFISFTGSKDVGLLITEQAAKRIPGQRWIKRVIAELGGKDATVVDETADLDAAASGIVAAAFGFQGQKCSACSRAIIVESVYDEVLAKVVAQTQALKIGDPTDPQAQVGPVINQESEDKVLRYIGYGQKEGRLMVGGNKLDRPGHFIAPTVFADIAADARLAQEEVFGPVLAFIKAKDYKNALEIANNTAFGLTGAFYSAKEERIQEARDTFFVGNLYLNRKCTGALVGVHPFGGFNLSGTDSKAGGRDYLLNFMQAKSVARKIL
jgi:1-pyrroline-5-carboxylate dehydrogenase